MHVVSESVIRPRLIIKLPRYTVYELEAAITVSLESIYLGGVGGKHIIFLLVNSCSKIEPSNVRFVYIWSLSLSCYF